jgi:hypothetical protein
MRYLPGYAPQMSNESISSFHLIKHAINDPDVLPTIFSLYQDEESPLSSILNQKGMKTKGLYEGMNSNKYRTVGSNHIQYAIEASDVRKMHFVTNEAGVTFESILYPTMPGYRNSPFYIYLDSNWAGSKEILEANDNHTQLYIYDTQPPKEVAPGVWRYEVVLQTNNREEYASPELMTIGSEIMPQQTAYEHDFSETGIEKYVFPTWGHSYLTLQRVKYSYSGTAEAMSMGKKWTIHNGAKGFLTEAEDLMMKRAADYNEFALIYGKQSVTADGQVLLHDKTGREIMTGSGIMYQGDGAYEYPYNAWTKKFLESLMQDVDLRAGSDGVLECALVGGKEVTSGFSRLMREYGITQNQNIEGSGSDKGINDSYSYYEFDGVRIVVKRWRKLDGKKRAAKELTDGTIKSSWDGFVVPLGKTAGGDNQVELVQLRKPKTGKVSGINEGGEGMATSVDGTSVHMLFQCGIISRAKITRIFRPYNS